MGMLVYYNLCENVGERIFMYLVICLQKTLEILKAVLEKETRKLGESEAVVGRRFFTVPPWFCFHFEII